MTGPAGSGSPPTGFAPLHACGHRTVFRSRRLNDTVAWWMGLLSFYNADFYRRYHQWHHRYTHQPGLDPLAAGSCTPLPASLGEALEAFAADAVRREALGEPFCQAYERLRRRQWNAYRSEVTDWERQTGLDG